MHHHPFDLRLIVLIRNKWSNALKSVISRYCIKHKRIKYIKLMLSIIQSNLLNIDDQFWIILNMDHLFKNYMEYIKILMPYFFKYINHNQDWNWMEMEFQNEFQMIFEQTMDNKPKHDYNSPKDNECKLTQNELRILDKYLRLDDFNEFSIFDKHNKFIVSPNNKQFLNENILCGRKNENAFSL